MYISNEFIKSIRNAELEIHCLNIKVWQDCDGGIALEGHGKIRQNKYGLLYVELVCTQFEVPRPTGPMQSFSRRFPSDSTNLETLVHAEFSTLSGDRFTSEGFTLILNELSIHSPFVVEFLLPYIQHDGLRESATDEDLLYYEFREKIDIPKNHMNKSESTKGYESSSWDESRIDNVLYNLMLRTEKDHTVAKVKGTFCGDSLIKCINFYVGFSSGRVPRPYIEIHSVGESKITRINSASNLDCQKRSSNPIPEIFSSNRKSTETEYSYMLFKNIYNLHCNSPDKLDAIISQWERVWSGFSSTSAISELVLSVAIEGVLNDIFIPSFKVFEKDEKLESDIALIKKSLDGLDIDSNYKGRLKGSVSYWKTITASKSLDILVNKGVIDKKYKKAWVELRNECAHPKSIAPNSAKEKEKLNNLLKCLDLFHRLVLNTVEYSGPVNIFGEDDESEIEIINHISVLK
ncbi:hypothetical protein [uncultured Ferrimonas sp.]|uniref:hypothetical protein n=1 Tax=uncultured Ferrimonas sp. TaxID=432640 RepID=UPI00261C86B1|nr:hypothetical protein [uncultured Ferrimonas sp.]